FPTIVGSVHMGARRRAALGCRVRTGGNGRIQPAACAGRNGHVDLRQALRQSFSQLAPVIPAIGRLEQAAVRTVEHVLVFPRTGTSVPESGVQSPRIKWIDSYHGGAGVLSLI